MKIRCTENETRREKVKSLREKGTVDNNVTHSTTAAVISQLTTS